MMCHSCVLNCVRTTVILCISKEFLLLFVLYVMQSKQSRDTHFLLSVLFTYHIISSPYPSTITNCVMPLELVFLLLLHPCNGTKRITTFNNLVNFPFWISIIITHFYYLFMALTTRVFSIFPRNLQKKNTHFFRKSHVQTPPILNLEMVPMRNSYQGCMMS